MVYIGFFNLIHSHSLMKSGSLFVVANCLCHPYICSHRSIMQISVPLFIYNTRKVVTSINGPF